MRPRTPRWAGNLDDVTETHLSKEAIERLSAELEDLTTRGRVEIARAIEAARALGDLSENGDYHAAKDAQGKMESRIRHLRAILESAVLIDAQRGPDGKVVAGCVVSLRYDTDNEVQRYLVGSIEERREDIPVISVSSPLGQVLIDRTTGEKVSYEAPSGTLTVEIVAVER